MKDAILVIGGAFNPVHTQHVAMLCNAKQELEHQGEWNIIGGYLAVAPDNYVRHKLSGRKEPTIKLKHRLALIQEAIKDIPWLANSPLQHEALKQHYGSALSLGQRIQTNLKYDQLQILILIGGDRMMKRQVPIWRQSVQSHSFGIRVGIGRTVADHEINLFALWEDDLNKNLIPNPESFLLLNISTQPVSSSLVRLHLNEWFFADNNPEKQSEIEDELVSKESFLDPSVMKYIKIHQADLYIDK